MVNAELIFDFIVFDAKKSKSDILKDCTDIIKSYNITGQYKVIIKTISRSFTPDGKPTLSISTQVVPIPVVKITKHGEYRFYNCTSEITEIEYNFWSKVHE